MKLLTYFPEHKPVTTELSYKIINVILRKCNDSYTKIGLANVICRRSILPYIEEATFHHLLSENTDEFGFQIIPIDYNYSLFCRDRDRPRGTVQFIHKNCNYNRLLDELLFPVF